MASTSVQTSSFSSVELDYKLPEPQQQFVTVLPESNAVSKMKKDSKRKLTIPFRCFDIVAVLTLILATLALLLVFIHLSISLNSYQSSSEETEIQLNYQQLQLEMRNLKNIQKQLNNSLMNFQSEINRYEDEILALAKQQDNLKEDFHMIELQTNRSSQDINTFLADQSFMSDGVQILMQELLMTKNLSKTVDLDLSLLQENLSMNSNKLRALQVSLSIINGTNLGISQDLGTFSRPASSCSAMDQNRASGYYWIQTSSMASPVRVYCDRSHRNCSCSTTGWWMRVANLDMTDRTQNCPDEFELITRSVPPLRICGRQEGFIGCVNTTYPTQGVEYSRVCGRIVAYQEGPPAAFHAYNHDDQDIDGFYIDGISVTHGQSPRQHIWSFVGAVSEQYTQNLAHICPCTRSNVGNSFVPPFIGEDYFCDTAIRDNDWTFGEFYPNDPLWDGQGCGGTSTCCSFNNPPWFCKELPHPTSDDIEVRLCDQQERRFSETPFEIIQLYIM